MERGTVILNNIELKLLYETAIKEGCQKNDLLHKLTPVQGVDDMQEHTVQISEEEAEIVLDCMPVPTEETDPHLMTARVKIQEFLAKSRFGDVA